MLQKRSEEQSGQESSGLDSIKDKLSKIQEKVIDTEISKEDRIVNITVTMDQICGCGGKDDVYVKRTVPYDSELQDGDKVEGFDETDEIIGYV